MKVEHKVAALIGSCLVVLGARSLFTDGSDVGSWRDQVLTLKLLEASPPKPLASLAPQTSRKSDAILANLIVPVEGVSRSRLNDTWGAPRDGGRTHKGIDIMADTGTPVRAAAAGKIIKLIESAKGGTTVYQTDENGRYIFYYAHLNGYAENLHVGQRVRQGELIAYVGETGNAPVPHLHFEIQTQSSGRKWWRGVAMNPYPVLKAGHVEVVSHVAQARTK